MEATENPTNTTTCQHEGEKYVTSGIVRCGQCFEDLDDSGHRPGLIEANQYR